MPCSEVRPEIGRRVHAGMQLQSRARACHLVADVARKRPCSSPSAVGPWPTLTDVLRVPVTQAPAINFIVDNFVPESH